MVLNVADALTAYKQSGLIGSSAASSASDVTSTDDGFGDMLKSLGNDAVSALKQGEQAATSGVTGKADVASVVSAISNAELMLTTVTTIRDKVIAAYQDITKTTI